MSAEAGQPLITWLSTEMNLKSMVLKKLFIIHFDDSVPVKILCFYSIM